MSGKMLERRDFLKSLLAGIPMVMLDWGSFPRAEEANCGENRYDALIIGAGLGGLSCAAAFARQGFKPLVLEQHYQPGGYATTFGRPGGFTFDVSLHSTSAGERDGIHNLIPGFPEITDVEFVPHPNLYRAIFPDYDIRVPQKDVPGYIDLLARHFPEEKEGIVGIIDDMKGVTHDINKLSNAQGQFEMSTFPIEYPDLFKCYNKIWGDLVNARITNPKLKAIISSLWGYYGLPPSKLASIYYALPTIGFMQDGGYYPKGRSMCFWG